MQKPVKFGQESGCNAPSTRWQALLPVIESSVMSATEREGQSTGESSALLANTQDSITGTGRNVDGALYEDSGNRERWKELLEKLAPIWASKVALAGLGVVLFWILVAVFAPLLTRYGPFEQDVQAVNVGPCREHWLGTDDVGRDLWARVAYGSRLVLVLAPLSVLFAMVVGVTLGLVGGYFGGLLDEVVMRILDAVMAFPKILLYLVVITAWGRSTMNVVVAITISGAPGIARLVRGVTLDIRTRDYIAAARLRGERPLYIMLVEILPNAMGPILVDAMLRVGYAVFTIGTLGFLGLGLPPPAPDWGSMVQRGHAYVFTNPWAVLWPSVAVSSLVVGLNFFADGLREQRTRR